MKPYLDLVNLQCETIGAHFTLNYSTVKRKHTIYFPGIRKRFEHSNVEELLNEAIKHILENRTFSNDKTKYTVMKFL